MNKRKLLLGLLLAATFLTNLLSQVTYSDAASYSLRKLSTSYSGSAIQVRRACDNATKNIGFTSCGELDTTALKTFVLAATPLSFISSTTDAAYGLRKLKCTYAGSAIQIRRSCDNATKDIGFTTLGDLDTTTLKNFVVIANPLTSLSVNAAAAFSLRKLYCSYVGFAIQVRRSTGGTQDIGFTANGDLDTASLKTFVGANSAFVTIWYDQSGNGRNLAQATNANQPRIVNAGTVHRQNGQPAIFLDGTNYYMTQATLTVSNPYTLNTVASRTASNGGHQRLLHLSAATDVYGYLGTYIGNYATFAGNGVATWNDIAANAPATSVGASSAVLTSVVSAGAGGLLPYINGTAQTAKNGTMALTSTGFVMGATYNATNVNQLWTGYISEFEIFTSALSTTDRQFLEWNQAQYYTITGPTLTTMPANVSSAFVTTWYDQSGNAYNCTQATTANQPRIINVGVIDRNNGTPAIYFNGTSNYMQNSTYTLLLNSQTPTWNAVICPIATNATFSPIVSWRVAGGICSQLEVGPSNNWNTCYWSNNTNWALTNGTVLSNGSYQILTALTTATTTQLYFNGSLSFNNTGQVNTAATAGSPASGNTTPLYIGYDNGFAGRFIKGYIPEIVLASTNMSTTDRQWLEYNQSLYYSISGPTITTMPAAAPSAYVTTWYDQSGNSRNLLQATTTRQPQVMSSGALVKIGVHPTILGNTAAQTSLTTNAFTTNYTGTVLSAATVFQPDVSSTANLRVMSVGNGTGTADWSSTNYFNVNERSTNTFVIERSGVNPSTTITVGSPLTLGVLFNGTNRQLFNNGTGSATTADASAFNFNMLRVLGSINPAFEAGESITGRMSEYSLFYSALSTTRRTLIETNQSAYYNITVSTNKYTPPAANTYNLYVTGVGRTSATDSVAATRSSAGMGFTVGQTAGDFLKTNGDYITAGISCPSPVISTANLPGTVVQRWFNDWYVNKTDVGSDNGTLNIYFDFSEYGASGAPGTAANYVLLARNSTASNFSIVSGTSVSVSGDRIIFLVDASNITTNFYYTVGTTNPTTSPLPIELLNFDAVVCERNVCLNWATATEHNNDFFTIDKSKNGTDFEFVSQTDAVGNSFSTSTYSSIDVSPYEGISYYRLKQTDVNGTYTYSNLVPAEFISAAHIIVYPNPNSGTMQVSYSLKAEEKGEFTIYDAVGKQVSSFRLPNSEKTFSINAADIEDGVYFFKYIINGVVKDFGKIIITR
ncbi:MAG: T9SS type A sorting domain-containing protein [Bacteroidia bacterium]|nr:T9SS type A sorting domain-containing protein [Bacteroidia bacterium]